MIKLKNVLLVSVYSSLILLNLFLTGVESIAWNHMEFEVSYPSLVDEVRVGDYYLRVLLQHNQPTGCLAIDVKNPVEFFDELYRRFLTAPKPSLRSVYWLFSIA